MEEAQRERILAAAFGNGGIYAEDKHILLRRVQDSDKENCLNVYRNKPVWQLLFAASGQQLEEDLWHDLFHDKKTFNMIIIRKTDGCFCGFCGLSFFGQPEPPELSIDIAKDCRKQGIGYRALTLLMARYAEITGKKEFISKVDYANLASQRLMRKLGGKPDGVEFEPDELKRTLAHFLVVDAAEPDEKSAAALAKEFGTTPEQLDKCYLLFRFQL